MCTRNNNFSNRSQKGKIVVKAEEKAKSDQPESDEAWVDDLSKSTIEEKVDVKDDDGGTPAETSKRDGGVNKNDDDIENQVENDDVTYKNNVASELDEVAKEINNDSKTVASASRSSE